MKLIYQGRKFVKVNRNLFYDVSQSEAVKTRIDGVVREKYSFYVQLKASDRLNCNYLSN